MATGTATATAATEAAGTIHGSGSAISFYQLNRTVAYCIASALSATVLILATPPGGRFPADAGYGAAALVSTAVLIAALVVSSLFVAAATASGRRRSG